MTRVRQVSPAQRRHAATMRRDGALARLSSITAAVGAAIVVAVGALGLYVAKAFPGHHASSTTGASSSSSGTTGTGNSGTTGTGNSGQSSLNPQSGLNPPSTPTQGTSVPPPVTSGAS